MAVKIDADKCTGCESCVEECPSEAIKVNGEIAVVDEETCIDCGICVDTCPAEAIRAE